MDEDVPQCMEHFLRLLNMFLLLVEVFLKLMNLFAEQLEDIALAGNVFSDAGAVGTVILYCTGEVVPVAADGPVPSYSFLLELFPRLLKLEAEARGAVSEISGAVPTADEDVTILHCTAVERDVPESSKPYQQIRHY